MKNSLTSLIHFSASKQANLGVFAYKQLLLIAYNKNIVTAKVDNNNIFGNGTEQATNEVLKRLGYKQNGIAGDGLVKALGNLLISRY